MPKHDLRTPSHRTKEHVQRPSHVGETNSDAPLRMDAKPPVIRSKTRSDIHRGHILDQGTRCEAPLTTSRWATIGRGLGLGVISSTRSVDLVKHCEALCCALGWIFDAAEPVDFAPPMPSHVSRPLAQIAGPIAFRCPVLTDSVGGSRFWARISDVLSPAIYSGKEHASFCAGVKVAGRQPARIVVWRVLRGRRNRQGCIF